MLDEANDLGLQFPGNISNVKLTELLAESKGEPTPIFEDAPKSPAVKAEPTDEDSDTSDKEILAEIARLQALLQVTDVVVVNHGRTPQQVVAGDRRKMVAKARIKAFRKHIVTITNRDPRENDKVTTAYLAFENQYFGIARSVPLDIQVELEEALIQIAACCTMPQHRDEIINNKRTGNKITIKVKKYVISYSNKTPN